MAFSVIQAGSALQLMSDTGVITSLVLPATITIDPTKAPHFTVFDKYVVIANSPSRPLTVDETGTVRPLCLLPPATATTLSGAAGGSLTGTYKSLTTFIIQDEFGNVISESDISPESNAVAIVTDYLRAENVPTSLDTATTGRRLYRTTTDGSVFFQWVDVDSNLTTAVQDDLSDAGLSTVAMPVLGTCPHLKLIAEWRGRLWGVGDDTPEELRYTEAGAMYAWPSDNALIVPPKGADTTGATALMPRREELGVGRLNQLVKIVGDATETVGGDIDISPVILSREVGVLSQSSTAIYRDQWYFLWYDGVYRWGPDGIECISDGKNGKGMNRAWFTTDNFFNRARFQFAFGFIDSLRYKYILVLATPDSDVENTWVEYDIADGTWWGPSSTGAFVPTCGFTVLDSDNILRPLMGSSSGFCWTQQETRSDGENPTFPIDFDVIGKRHDLSEPNKEKYFGQITLIGKAQPAGSLTVRSYTGELDASTPFTQLYNMTKARQRMGRLGSGKHCQVRLSNNEIDQDVELYSYEIEAVHVTGRR